MAAASEPITAHLTSETPISPAIEAWKIFLEDQARSTHTIKAFGADVRLLAKFLPPTAQLARSQQKKLISFSNGWNTGAASPAARKHSPDITSVKSFFRWLQGGGAILVDPAEKVVQKSVLSPLPAVLTPDEVEAVVNAANRFRESAKPDTRYAVLLLLLLQTGIKKSETLGLSPNHVELDAPEGPFIFIRYASPSHRYKERKIPVNEIWVEVYKEYQTQYELTDRLLPWSQRRLEYLLEDISDEAGIKKHLSFAMCRWTSALIDFRNGVDQNKIRQKLGISKIQWREIKMKLTKLEAKTE